VSSDDYNQVVAAANNIGEVSQPVPNPAVRRRNDKITKKPSRSKGDSSDRARRKVKGSAARSRRTR
jgi:hypothetical protein